MSEKKQRSEIKNSLKIITEIFGECNANYRVVGSILLVAYKNKIFRRINDVDIMVDAKSKECVLMRVKKAGFVLEEKPWLGFRWIEAKKEGYLGLTFLLAGDFLENYFRWPFMKFFELRIKSDYMQPTEYNFEGVKFIGIPISSVMAGVKQSFLNPKRKIDKKILEEEQVRPNTYNQISVYVFGIKIPFLYDIFSFVYNIYGGLRVIFGKKYEMW